MGRSKKAKWESALLNNRTYLQYYNRLLELAINMYEWKNLPDTVDERFLELTLFSDGMAVYFRDEILGDLCLQTMIGGNLDVYRIPMERTAYAANGYQVRLDPANSVIIFNNYTHTNSMLDIEMYARRLYNIERTIDVNVNAQKTPVMVIGSEAQRLTLKNLMMQYDGNEPFIYGDDKLNVNALNVLRLDAPYVADKLNILKRQIWNEALTYLGIENSNTEKKERLVTDEITSNLGGVEAQRFCRLNARRKAADQINAMFGTNITVGFREENKVKYFDEAEDEEKEDTQYE
ncbi:portal protein [Hungatella phage CH17P1]|nr:portal protein [Hungatella phage CH17P1]